MEAGSDINKYARIGSRRFQFVGNLEVVHFLIEAGADINKYARIGSRP